jgi:DNA polymerase-3 subunit gamma/tau
MGKKVDTLVDLPSAEIDQLMEQAREITTTDLNRIFNQLFKEEASIRMSLQPKLALEIAFIRMLQVQPALPINVLIDKLDVLRKEVISGGGQQKIIGDDSAMSAAKSSFSKHSDLVLPADAIAERKSDIESKFEIVPSAIGYPQNLEQNWKSILEIISEKNPSLAANLAKCRLKHVADQRLEIEVDGNGFTLKMIQREKNMELLRRVCADLFGIRMEIILTTADTADNGARKKKTNDDQLIQKALNHPLVADAIDIFNGTLVEVKIF